MRTNTTQPEIVVTVFIGNNVFYAIHHGAVTGIMINNV